MENRLYLYNLGIKTFGGFATLGGGYTGFATIYAA